MRLSLLRNSALLSLIGLSSTQSTSSWGEPFNVDVSTDSLLESFQQPLTNVVGTSTPATTGLAPIAPVTDEFSTTIPTELSTGSTGSATGVVVVSSSASGNVGSASASASVSASADASASVRQSSSSRASSSGSGAATQSTAAAAPVGLHGQQKMMGVAGALAGAAGVLFA